MEAGKFDNKNKHVITRGVSCPSSNYYCEDAFFGTMAWGAFEQTCTKRFKTIYEGDAKLFASAGGNPDVVMVNSNETEQYMGKPNAEQTKSTPEN